MVNNLVCRKCIGFFRSLLPFIVKFSDLFIIIDGTNKVKADHQQKDYFVN